MRHLANPTAVLARSSAAFTSATAELDAALAASEEVDAAMVATYAAAKSAIGDALAFAATLPLTDDRLHRILWGLDISTADTLSQAMLTMRPARVAAIRALCA